jgi:hypothetical protein
MTITYTASTSSHKARQKDRQTARKTVLTPAPIVSSDDTQQSQDDRATNANEVEVYECVICSTECNPDGGIVPCEHFMCNDCAVWAFELAVQGNGLESFPAKCCQPIHRRLAEHLLTLEIVEKYKAKALEYYTSRVLRVYCVDCGKFLAPYTFSNDDAMYTVAKCACGANTCVGCKQTWDENHHCDDDDDSVNPDWLPEYTSSCRIKRCPSCRMWIEHMEACNHMTCNHCRHEFCFICKLPWQGFHDDAGCPSYGEPAAGYDEGAYELTERGLHRETGLDRDGNNRYGVASFGHMQAQILHDDDDDNDGNQAWNDPHAQDHDPWEDQREDHGWGDYPEDDGWANVLQDAIDDEFSDDSDSEVDEDDDGWNRFYQQTDALAEAPPAQPPTHVPRAQRSPTSAGGHLSFTTIDCAHEWHNRGGPGRCMVCHYSMPYFHYECTTCNAIVCDYCHLDFPRRLALYTDEAELSLVAPIQWAEDMVPFRRDRIVEWIIWQMPDTEWHVDTLFEAAEEELYAAQPFLYWDFGIADMFAELEKDATRMYWLVTEENVGISGMTMSLRMDGNPFAPLLWEEEELKPLPPPRPAVAAEGANRTVATAAVDDASYPHSAPVEFTEHWEYM